jgi:riboflavin kinase / FMN adenylyltransferase
VPVTRFVTWEPGLEGLGAAVVSIGVFDGVHLGHQALIRDAVSLARAQDHLAAVVTFDRDPDRVVDPEHAAPQLLELDDKLDLIAALGPDVVLVVPFTANVAAMPPETFLDRLLLAVFAPAAVVVGYDFRFGARAAGHLETLQTFGPRHGFDVVGHPLVHLEGEPVTSTRIRQLVAGGDVAAAASLLGRPHRVKGVVVGGRAEGRKLGARTANLATAPYAALPADGVYAGRIDIDGVVHPAGVSVGVPPTFPDASCRLEAHVLDFDGDLYGRRLQVEFLERLRDQRRFDSAEELAAAIAEDLDRVRAVAERSGETW